MQIHAAGPYASLGPAVDARAPPAGSLIGTSAAYAENVSGEVRAVVGSNLRPGNVWQTVDIPRLEANPNVTRIIEIDPETGVERQIYP